MIINNVDFIECDSCGSSSCTIATNSIEKDVYFYGDKVECLVCGNKGLIECELGIAFPVWESN